MRRWDTVLAAVLVLAVRPASADWPPAEGADLKDPANWPDDPGYASQWPLWSFVPDANAARLAPAEVGLGAGMHVDEAWQVTRGDPRVLVAVLDSGLDWGDPGIVTHLYLNRGELPPPDEGCGPIAARADPHDADGDGVFNVQDYAVAPVGAGGVPVEACDTRLLALAAAGDLNGNGVIDPQDLLRVFSDGLDDDDNGYVDDVSGWDLFRDDNDAEDDVACGHGAGQLGRSGAGVNDGRAGAGVCDGCQLMMVRIGDSFIVDANAFARGVVFAVDTGATVIAEAQGALGNNDFVRSALAYAHASDVFVVGAAGDQDSVYPNFPAANDHVVMVNGLTTDDKDWTQAASFLRFNNCTNYGAQIVLSLPAPECSSEATGLAGGIAGLIYSAALASDVPFPGGAAQATDPRGARRLSADEVRQLLVATVDDVRLDPEGADPATYRSRPGWDQRFGYGRPQVRRALDALLAGAIPPEAYIEEPAWLTPVDRDRTPEVTVRYRVSQRSGEPVAYVLEWAPGMEPDEGAWQTLTEGSADAGAQTYDWDVSQLVIDNPTMAPPDRDMNRFLVTLRLRATAADGTTGEMRKAFFLQRDPALKPGYPLDLGASGESSPRLADLDGDGRHEIVVVDTNGLLHALDAAAAEAPGFPVALEDTFGLHASGPGFADGSLPVSVGTTTVATPAVGDLDGDGDLDVVVATVSGHVHAVSGAGAELPGWPVALDRELPWPPDPDHPLSPAFHGSPALYDVDGDGGLEVIAAADDGRLYVWRGDATPLAPFPVAVAPDPTAGTRRLVASPAVGDLDGDGAPEIVLTDHGVLHAVSTATGRDISGFPVSLNSMDALDYVAESTPSAPILADVDRDGALEVIVYGLILAPGVVRADGSRGGRMSLNDYGVGTDVFESPMMPFAASGACGDLDNDGRLDLALPGLTMGAMAIDGNRGVRSDFEHVLGCWEMEGGDFLPGCPRRMEDWMFMNGPSIADVDDDGLPEMLVGSAGYAVHAFDYLGEEAPGFPKGTGGWITATPAVGDVDGDGRLDVVVTTRNGWLFAWSTDGRTDGRVDWSTFHHDNAGTGNYATPLDVGVAWRPPPAGGCGCATGGSRARRAGLALLGLCLLALAAIRTRRGCR